jgi:hypothetical protein
MTNLDFFSFSGALLDQGETLFFPSLQERLQNPVDPGRADTEGGAIRVDLVGHEGAKLSGECFGLTLFVQVNVGQLRAIRNGLRGRDLTADPTKFEFELDADGGLLSLKVDKRELE